MCCSDQQDESSFDKGDIMTDIENTDNDWWIETAADGSRGMFHPIMSTKSDCPIQHLIKTLYIWQLYRFQFVVLLTWYVKFLCSQSVKDDPFLALSVQSQFLKASLSVSNFSLICVIFLYVMCYHLLMNTDYHYWQCFNDQLCYWQFVPFVHCSGNNYMWT